MTAAWALPTPAPVVSPGRHDATGATNGVGLTVVEPEPSHWSERLDCQKCGIPQEVGDWLIWGIAAEGLGWPMIGDSLVFVLINMGALGAVIVGQLALRERAKRCRIAARTKRTPAWAG